MMSTAGVASSPMPVPTSTDRPNVLGELVALVYAEFLNWLPPEVVGRMGGIIPFNAAIKGFCERYSIDTIGWVYFYLDIAAKDHTYSEMKIQICVHGKSASGKAQTYLPNTINLGRTPVDGSWNVRIDIDDSLLKRTEKTG